MNELCKSCVHRFQCLTGESRDWMDCLINLNSSSLINHGREGAVIPIAFLKERAKAKKEDIERERKYANLK